MTKPVTFHCTALLPQTPAVIAQNMLDLARWPEFNGYGFLPGIASAAWELQVPGVVGSRIRVQNQDGSSHVEEIITWQPDRQIQLQFRDFSPPVSRLATTFVETWEFQPQSSGTLVKRSMELHARNFASRCVLACIALLLRKAIARHLRALAKDA